MRARLHSNKRSTYIPGMESRGDLEFLSSSMFYHFVFMPRRLDRSISCLPHSFRNPFSPQVAKHRQEIVTVSCPEGTTGKIMGDQSLDKWNQEIAP